MGRFGDQRGAFAVKSIRNLADDGPSRAAAGKGQGAVYMGGAFGRGSVEGRFIFFVALSCEKSLRPVSVCFALSRRVSNIIILHGHTCDLKCHREFDSRPYPFDQRSVLCFKSICKPKPSCKKRGESLGQNRKRKGALFSPLLFFNVVSEALLGMLEVESLANAHAILRGGKKPPRATPSVI